MAESNVWHGGDDEQVLTGDAAFTGDLAGSEFLHAAVVRSSVAHAEIRRIDTEAAESVPGVRDVLTASDIERASVPTPANIPSHGAPSPDSEMPPDELLRRPIAKTKVRYQGDPLAVVLAESPSAAHDGARQTSVEYDRLEPTIDVETATAPAGPPVHDGSPDNVAFEVSDGDRDAVRDAFERAAYTPEIETGNQRLVQNPIETRAILAAQDAETGKLDVTVTTQIPHQFRRVLGRVLGLPETRLDVRVANVGGAFGSKIPVYPAEVLVSWCGLYCDRPVAWQATRFEAYQSDAQGRGLKTKGRLAVTAEGDIRAVELSGTYDLGAYISSHAAMIVSAGVATITGQYEIPNAHSHITGVMTNKTPLDAYRGVTEPDVQQTLERLVDRAAREMGIDPAQLRRRNFVDADQFPYETAVGSVYDSGNYEPAFGKALETAGYAELRDRQKRLRAEGRYLGIGLAPWIESSGLGPCKHEARRIATWGYSKILFHPSGTVTAHVGSADQGQHHKRSFRRVLTDAFGVPADDIEIVLEDTATVSEGAGTYGSRSGPVEGGGLRLSSEKLLRKASRVAAHYLEAGERDVEFSDGTFQVVGAPELSVTLGEVAHEAHHGRVPEGMEPGLKAETYYDPENFTFSFGTHVAVVEVDPGTGELEFHDYVAVEDCGNQIDPQIVEGQVHGGVAQGIGQALYEQAVYDQVGNLLTGSHQDYTVPRTIHVPEMTTEHTVTPSPHNPLGVKGVGESGAIAAPIAVANAVEDALAPFGVDSLTLPLTDEKIWRAMAAE
jgi:carbon-monoxide dehydrogenase large subunit